MTEGVYSASGQQIYAPSLTVGQEKRAIRLCRKCGGEFVWVPGKKGWYPAAVFRTGKHGARKYAPWQPHKCPKEES